MCNENVLIRMENYQHAVYKLARVLFLAHFYKMNYLCNAFLCNKQVAHGFSKLIRRSISTLPGKGLKYVFLFQMSSRVT
jgi:hypothetical protein